MACPVAAVTVVVAALGGARALLMEDRRYRVLAWVGLAVIVGGWGAYYLGVDAKPFRVAMEALSTIGLLAAILRIRYLMRSQTFHSPVLTAMTKLPRQAWAAIGSPWLIIAKVWLVAMVVMEWRGKADFSGLEYTVVSVLLVAVAAGQFVLSRRARPRFAGLESLASSQAPATCPFGFGCELDAPASGSPHDHVFQTEKSA